MAAIIGTFLAGVGTAHAARTTQDLSGNGWSVWLDEKAEWKNDPLYWPREVNLEKLPVNPPTGGWGTLDRVGKPAVVPGCVEEYFSGGTNTWKYTGVSWFWRDMDVPADWKGKVVRVLVEKARLRCELFINGKLAAYDIVAETPFECDTSKFLEYGKRNRIAFRLTSIGGNRGWGGGALWLPRTQVWPGLYWKQPVPLAQLHEIWWTGDRPCTQAGQVMPLALGMVPPENRAAVEQSLLREIAAHRGKVSTGFVATPYLLQVLADLNPEAGWKMTAAREFPSWHSMTRGCDSDLLKETWAGGQALMPSLGGNIAGWHTEALAGIRPAAPGFKKIIIKPAIVGDLTWVECDFESPYGRIVSNWKKKDGVQMDVVIPPNTTATVYVPAKDAAAVTESGKPAVQADGVKFVKMENGAAVYEVRAGTYCFRVWTAEKGM